MMEKRILTAIIMTVSLTTAVSLSAQKVTFFSPGFEEGVKTHLGLTENDDVPQQRTDTITNIDLSGLGIDDIRDVVYLPNVQTLDLSFNDIRDVTPLLPLDSLHNVDLRGNQLEDVNVLTFASSDSMVVSVAYNYIKDFSSFFLPSPCRISISGMSAQKDRNAVYIDLHQLYADIEEGQPVVKYRGYSNMEGNAYLDCGTTHVRAVLDGSFNTVRINDVPASVTEAGITNGEKGESTYVVPPVQYYVPPGKTKKVAIRLPDDYRIGFASAMYGTVSANGLSLSYTAPVSGEEDTVFFSYYKGQRLKGFSQFYMTTDASVATTIQQTGVDESLGLSWQDGRLFVVCPQGALDGCAEAVITVWSAEGKLLATEKVDASGGIDTVLNVVGKRGNVLIVQVDACGKRLIGKCLLAK